MHRRFLLFVIAALSFCPSLAAQDQKPHEKAQGSDTTKSGTRRIRIQPLGVKLVHSAKAVYPQTAKERKIQGAVRLDIVIATNGKVLEAKVISGDPLLAESAVGRSSQMDLRADYSEGRTCRGINVCGYRLRVF